MSRIARRTDRPDNVLIEDAQVIFKNFRGEEGKYNKAGDRNFGVLLDDDLARRLLKEGWNVKTLKARDEGDEPQPWIPVAIGYGYRPPKIMMVTSGGRNELTEDLVASLDWADWEKADIILRPYPWSVSGSSGIKAYVKTLVVVIAEDYLELKYRDVPEIGAGPAPDPREPVAEIEGGQPYKVIPGSVIDEDDVEF
jgi:hypothetical protein